MEHPGKGLEGPLLKMENVRNKLADIDRGAGIKVSLVIAARNVGTYLARCIGSFLCDGLPRYEIILVTGRSEDNTNEVCEEYCRRFLHVRMIEQDGTGLSNARNCAIRVAEGDYILFADGDDFADDAVFYSLLEAILRGEYYGDLIMTDFYRYFESSQTRRLIGRIGEKKLRGIKNLPEVLEKHQCFWNVWHSVYRRGFLLEHGLFFPEDTAYAEDVIFTTRVLLANPDVLFIGTPYYCYRMGREGSLTYSTPLRRVRETASALALAIEELRMCDVDWKDELIRCLQFDYLLNMALICEVDKKERPKARTAFAGWRQVMIPGSDLLIQAAAWVLGVVGIGPVSGILSFAKRMKRWLEGRAPLKKG